MTHSATILESAFEAVAEAIQGGMYPPGRRTQLEVAYCHLAIEHQRAIAHLLDVGAIASAMALARPTFEAVVKGLWLYYCASDDQLEVHAGGKELLDIGDLIGKLKSAPVPRVVVESLDQVKSKYWKALSSLTHVGHTQLRHWLNPTTGVEPSYSDQSVLELANFASFMLLVAGRELTLRAGNENATRRLECLLPEWQDAV